VRANSLKNGIGFAALVMVAFVGCKSSELTNEFQSAESAHQASAAKNVIEVRDLYVQAMNQGLPALGQRPVTPKDDSPMLVWRKNACSVQLKLKGVEKPGQPHELASKQFEKFQGTPSQGLLEDGVALLTSLNNYWLGRAIQGMPEKKEWEEGYDKWKKTAPKKGARDRIPFKEHKKNLGQYIKQADNPWKIVADFEWLLPYVMQAYRFEHAAGRRPPTTFTPYWVDLFAMPMKIHKTPEGHKLKESYQDYRDRVCEGLGKACDVPYEYRDQVVRGAFLDKVMAKVATFKSTYPDSGLNTILDQFTGDLSAQRKKCEVPPEYPVLASTMAAKPTSSEYTSLLAGEKGFELQSDDPKDSKARKSTTLQGAREDWDLDESDIETINKTFVASIQALRDSSASAASTDRVHLFWDMSVPVGLLGEIMPGLTEAGVRDLHLVGRKRYDGSKRLRANLLTLVDKESRAPIAVGALSCTPIGGVGDSVPPADWIKGTVLVSSRKVTASKMAGGSSKTIALSADSSKMTALGQWLLAFKEPVLLGVRESTTQSQLNKVLNGLAWECVDEECTKTRSIDNILLAICQ